MYETILRLYQSGKITRDGVIAAVSKGWITEENRKFILGEE